MGVWSDIVFELENSETVRAFAVIVAASLFLAPAITAALRRRSPFRRRRSSHGGYRRPAAALTSAGGPLVLIDDLPETSPLGRPPNLSNPVTQIEAVADCDFERIPLLNREEARLLPLLEHAVSVAGNGHRLMAQTSLGELIRPVESSGTPESRRRGYASINSKRLDFSVINRFSYLVVAIEYQGSGHYQRQTFIRDAVKREALRKAGVETLLIEENFNPQEVRARLLGMLRPQPSRT